MLDERTGEPAVPNGSVGHRYAASDEGRWNLRLEGIEPALTLLDRAEERVAVDLPRFDVGEGEGGGIVRRGVPAIRIGGQLVTTVLDLVLAQYGVARAGLPGDWPAGYDDAECRARRRGRSRSPASTGSWRRGLRASSRVMRR